MRCAFGVFDAATNGNLLYYGVTNIVAVPTTRIFAPASVRIRFKIHATAPVSKAPLADAPANMDLLFYCRAITDFEGIVLRSSASCDPLPHLPLSEVIQYS